MNIVELLKNKKLTISTAESLTSGLVASKISEISGASTVFEGGVVSYTKDCKCRLLGLDLEYIEKYCVYSKEVALKMARGVIRSTKSLCAISTTGVAGPDDEGVSAGSVYFCFIVKDLEITEFKKFEGSRNDVRMQASNYAINRFVEILTDYK